MSTLLTASDSPEGPPLYRTVPLWVLDATEREHGIRWRLIASVKVMPKTATLTAHDGATFKVSRRNAFPGRSA